MLKTSTVDDAAPITAPISTSIRTAYHDPELNIGADADLSMVRPLVGTAVNLNAMMQASALVQGEKTYVLANTGSLGMSSREVTRYTDVSWDRAILRGKLKALKRTTPIRCVRLKLEHVKDSSRVKVAHSSQVIERRFLFCEDTPPQVDIECGATAQAVRNLQLVDSATPFFEKRAGMNSPSDHQSACIVPRSRDKSSHVALHWTAEDSIDLIHEVHAFSGIHGANFEPQPQP